jgi:hypothetical protein
VNAEEVLNPLFSIREALQNNRYRFDPVFSVLDVQDVHRMVDVVVDSFVNLDTASDDVQRERVLELASKTLRKIISKGNWWQEKTFPEIKFSENVLGSLPIPESIESYTVVMEKISKQIADFTLRLLWEHFSQNQPQLVEQKFGNVGEM